MNFLYAFCILLGLISGAAFFFWQLNKKKMPNLIWLFILMTGTIAIGWLGGRLWTYWFSDILRATIDQKENLGERIKEFFGINEGEIHGLSVHGALIFGGIYCFFVFNWYSQKYQISMWICWDNLFKATLICQIIGRWGNFFNQELLGEVISFDYRTEYEWIPQWFGEKLRFQKYDLPGTIRHPLFLYESFGNAMALFFICFILPNIGIFFSPKIRMHPAFKKIQWKKKSIWSWMKFKFKQWRKLKHLWNNNIEYPIIENKNILAVRIKPWKFNNQLIIKKFTMKLYEQQKQIINKEPNIFKRIIWKFLLFFQRDSSAITNQYNPLKLKMTRVGVPFFFYFLAYGIIRAILQPMREIEGIVQNDPMFITNIVSYIFIGVGLLGIIFCQWIIPYKWRNNKWFYESWYYV